MVNDIQRQINNINNQISRIAKKGRSCCGLNQRQCSECFEGIWKIKDLKVKKEKLYRKLKKFLKSKSEELK